MRAPLLLLLALLGAAAAASSSGSNDTCPAATFVCADATPGVLSPSWCSIVNPFIVPQPPAKLAVPSRDTRDYTQQYYCGANASDPFAACVQVLTFRVLEAPAANNTKTKLIVISQRTGGAADVANSSITLLNDHLDVLDAPVQGFPGLMDHIEAMPNPYDNTSSLVLYGGQARVDYTRNGTACDHCAEVLFMKLDLTVPGGFANSSAVYAGAGGFFERPATVVDTMITTYVLDAESAASVNGLSARRAAELGAATAPPPLAPGALTSIILLSVYNYDETSPYYGWSVAAQMYFPVSEPFCQLVSQPGYPCFLPIARWRVVRDGAPIPFTDPVLLSPSTPQLRMRAVPVWQGCSLSGADPTLPIQYAYQPFYGPEQCVNETLVMLLSDAYSVAAFALRLTNTTVDIGAAGGARVFDGRATPGLAPPGAAVISEVAGFSEVVIRDPSSLPTSASSGSIPVPPSAAWVSVSMYNPSLPDFTQNGTVIQVRLAAFSDPLPPAVAAGCPAAQSTGDGSGSAFPPCVTPTVNNSAGLPPAGIAAGCPFNAYYNGTACTPLPLDIISNSVAAYVTRMQVQWRSLPPHVVTSLVAGGCTPWNLTCIEALINATLANVTAAGGSLLPTPTPTPAPLRLGAAGAAAPLSDAATALEALAASAPPALLASVASALGVNLPGLSSPAHAARFASLPASERRAFVRLWAGARDRVLTHGVPLSNVTREVLSLMYGNRFVIFASLNLPQIISAEAVPMPCGGAPGDASGAGVVPPAAPASSHVALPRTPGYTPPRLGNHAGTIGTGLGTGTYLNTYFASAPSLLGPALNLDVSPNGQFFFAAVSRQASFLAAMERIVDICNALETNPHDPFLASYAASCNGPNPVRLPTVGDFIVVASACLPGMLCPSFTQEVLESLPPGSYSSFGFDLNACEPGFMCSNGQRTPCPQGFVCPEPGMAMPRLCPEDGSLNTTCASTGLVAPEVCPEGTLCGIPFLPPIPASPGFLQSYDDNGFRTLTACDDGQWCGLGRAASEGNATLLCPAGTFCDAPTVLEPDVCNLGGACNTTSCPVIPYCPAGSETQALCPAGYFCSNTTHAERCSLGTLCPAGSVLWQLCPGGRYCPDPSASLRCPDGHYCPEGSFEPIACSTLSHCFCDNGCEEPPYYTALAIGGIAQGFVLFLWAAWFFFYRQGKGSARSAMQRCGSRHAAGKEETAAAASEDASYAELAAEPLLAASPAGGAGGAATSGGDSLMLSPKEYTIDISFSALGLRLKKGGKSVLDGVTGELRHGRVAAVMGPSGAGKTTFLTTLCGKATYGNLNGDVRINGKPGLLTDKAYKHLVGFVPQEDILMRDMTVRENILHSALTRLPATWSVARKTAFADSVIETLGLKEIRDSLIGDETTRGISGGQRKRVNVGVELAADPVVLFLDEPTSGLDATGSMQVCGALRRIADLGLTVALVLHQPRLEIFMSFDDLLLLGKGGRTVYMGPVASVVNYFDAVVGIKTPSNVNPADFLLDVVGGDVPPEWRRVHPDFSPSSLFSLWETNQGSWSTAAVLGDAGHAATAMAVSINGGGSSTRSSGAGLEMSFVSGGSEVARPNPGAPPAYHPVSFFRLVWLYFKRALTQQKRHPVAVILNNGLAFSSALFLALVYFGDPSYAAPEPIEAFGACPSVVAQSCQVALAEARDSVLNRGIMTIISVSLTGVATFLPVFGAERIVYWREASALRQPLQTLAYFLGKDLAMLPQMIAGPFVFTLAYDALAAPRAAFMDYFFVFAGVYWCSAGFGYITSVLAPPSLAQLMGVTSIFANAMFAGGQPTLRQMRDKFAPLCWLPMFSYMRYALEAAYVAEVSTYSTAVSLQGLDLGQLIDSNFGYDLGAFKKDVIMVAVIGAVLRVIAVTAMVLSDSAKKK